MSAVGNIITGEGTMNKQEEEEEEDGAGSRRKGRERSGVWCIARKTQNSPARPGEAEWLSREARDQRQRERERKQMQVASWITCKNTFHPREKKDCSSRLSLSLSHSPPSLLFYWVTKARKCNSFINLSSCVCMQQVCVCICDVYDVLKWTNDPKNRDIKCLPRMK